MKIQANQFFNLQSNMKKQTQATNSQSSTSELYQKRSFDELVISSRPAPVTDESFATDVSKEISSEAKATSSDEKLESLKAQIEEGTYQIDLGAIARKMILG
ncbi:MAG: flagellar biosynthesis anti-sigma factor FlgM [Lachnospiraceae bacterium]|nr:flagellar biosynthesis anti-sigma factor FlgM [Lachnospiraceae bacterium]